MFVEILIFLAIIIAFGTLGLLFWMVFLAIYQTWNQGYKLTAIMSVIFWGVFTVLMIYGLLFWM